MDLETNLEGKINEIGLVFQYDAIKTLSSQEAYRYIERISTAYIVGHNIIAFDKKILEKTSLNKLLEDKIFIDTLPISMLLFNEKTFHNLPKNYKSEDNFCNDPVNDAKLSKELLFKSIDKFSSLPILQRNVLYTLLKEEQFFQGFFSFIQELHLFEELSGNILRGTILNIFKTIIKNSDVLDEALKNHRVELAFILAIRMPELEVNAQPPKVLYDYKDITSLQERLCFDYESSLEELSSSAKEIFGFGTFRDFVRQDATLDTGSMLSQKEIVAAALKNESFLAVLPTGGGKTFTFWLPSLIKAKSLKTLTVVISPLQALIKDHMESFHETVANYKAVALSGYLSPSERAEAMEKVVNGDADILYLAPESLRSNAVFTILKNRVIERFVIDEAHCLSTWGNDFRHDYFYIATFINDLLAHKPFQKSIPVSCFTATAKPKVMDDITEYIESSLNVIMNRYIAVPERKNLDYEGYELDGDKAKYTRLLELVETNKGSTLIYIPSSTRKCDEVAEQLARDTGKNVKSFHSKLDTDIKMQILKEYINDTIDIVVATTAFGMGVDKPNIQNVIHYEISESLENYSQEAGRGARDQNIRASCPLLFSQSDLDKHFTTLTRSKINADEINAVFNVLKNDVRNPVALTSREIASKAGWDTEDSSHDYDMKVKTALLELEREEYIERSRNKVHFYADALAKDSVALLHEAFKTKGCDQETQTRLSRVLQTLLSSTKPQAVQLDELTEILGYSHELVTRSVLELKAMNIISDAKDLSLKLNQKSFSLYQKYAQIEKCLFESLQKEPSHTVRMSELNQILLNNEGLELKDENNSSLIKVLLKSWIGDKHNFKFNRIDRQKDLWYFEFLDSKKVANIIDYKHSLGLKILEFLSVNLQENEDNTKESVAFSMLELERFLDLKETQSLKIIDKTLLHLHELRVLELGSGRFIYYAPMSIKKLDKMLVRNKKYTKDEYKTRMEPYYQRKMESIHIVGAYSERLIKNSKLAEVFMKDYFTLSYRMFLNKYGELKEKFKRPMTEYRYNKIFNTLSQEQKNVIHDKESAAMMVLAGPGSGKTKVLVHKIASLILQEDIKADQFLMLTYSRTAMIEFKSRLFELIGQLAYDIDIFTFHGFALQLIGREAHNDGAILQDAVAIAAKHITEKKIEIPFKTVVVLDEYQDINNDGFELIEALAKAHGNTKRMIAVGDDDQCILSQVNGADVRFIKKFEEHFGRDEEGNESYATYELLTNFRSSQAIVAYSNKFISHLSTRYKKHPLNAHTNNAGTVVVVHCTTPYLQQPAVQEALEELKSYEDASRKTLALLAYTNNEVADVYALLREKNIAANYLLDNEGFKIKSLVEVKLLTELLEDGEFSENFLWVCFDKVKEKYGASKNIVLVDRLIKKFIDEHEVCTFSLWHVYLDEVSSEQLIANHGKVLVSTIHKAKGKEFDTVVLIAKRVAKHDELFFRLFYVAMTRAKKKLIIVTDDAFFSQNKTSATEIVLNHNEYLQPIQKTLIMGLSDIYLQYRSQRDKNSLTLLAGSKVTLQKQDPKYPYSIVLDHFLIGRLSKKMQNELEKSEAQGYKIVHVNIENVVAWYDEKIQDYRELPLCKIIMSKEA
ncbi:MAG: RecQ family ATP-dependent DNA helicase [Sulfurimonadaceae bacterium]